MSSTDPELLDVLVAAQLRFMEAFVRDVVKLLSTPPAVTTQMLLEAATLRAYRLRRVLDKIAARRCVNAPAELCGACSPCVARIATEGDDA